MWIEVESLEHHADATTRGVDVVLGMQDVDAVDEDRALGRLLEAVETAATLSRVEALVFVHRLLRVWIMPHVFTTSLMLALMIVHIVQVIFFVVR